MGRQAVLDVMARLRKHTTIFYSTHILDDVQRISDTVAILNRGQLMACGPIEQILKGGDGVVYTIVIKGTPDGIGRRLASLPWVAHTTEARHNGTSVWQVTVSDEPAAEKDLLRHLLADNTILVAEYSRKKYELEEVFMEIVNGDSNVH